jgi:hypothetical protein
MKLLTITNERSQLVGKECKSAAAKWDIKDGES